MVIENKGIEKIYSFYVSDFHLEMILLPFIKNKMAKEENVIIKSEYDLKDSLEVLLSKINMTEKEKSEILNLDWDKTEKTNEIKNDTNVIIIGNKNYISNINEQIGKNNINNATIVDCYKVDDIKGNVEDIVKNYNRGLTTNIL